MDEQTLLTRIAGLTIMQKRLTELLADAKRAYLASASQPERAEAVFDGVAAATVSVDRGSDGRWTVMDPAAYAAWLAANGHADLTVLEPTPTPEAVEDGFIRSLVPDEDSPVPDGVRWSGGKKGAVRVTLRRGMVERAFDAKRLAEIVLPAVTGESMSATRP